MSAAAGSLFPLEQVEGGETKIPVTISLARMMGAPVVLLHVLPPHTLDSSVVLPDEARARACLETIAAQIHTAGITTAVVVRSGAPARSIVEESETTCGDPREEQPFARVLGATQRGYGCRRSLSFNPSLATTWRMDIIVLPPPD